MEEKSGLYKECNKCGGIKPLEDFHKLELGKFGRRPECKTCRNLYKRAFNRGVRHSNK